MSSIQLGATGKLVRGSIFDCDKAQLESALRFYDSQLYIEWNPKKNNGYGVWELRRRPAKKSIVYKGSHASMHFHALEYVENPMINHVMDMPNLSYKVIERLKAIDTWNVKNWAHELDAKEEQFARAQREKARAEMRYNIKQFRTQFLAFKEMLLSGLNPHLITKYWGSNL